MDLRAYLASVQVKPTVWATKNGIAPSVISRLLNGKGISLKNALRIQRATGGEVAVSDLLLVHEQDAA